jgi:Leucine-rich repeat (LRR) protein
MLELSASSRLTMRELSLHLCGIHAVESGAISLWMPHLRDLSFTHNSLDAVPGDVLIGLPELERLSFGRNPVSQGWLDARPFASAQLSLLRYLDFSPPAVMQSQEDGEEEKGRSASATVESDEVVAIRRGTFAGLSGLEDLSVHGFARLSRVEEGVWDNLPGLRRLKLDGNNISRAFSLANDSWVGEGAALLNLTQLEFLDMSQKKGAGNPLSRGAVERAVAGLPSGCYYYTRYGPGRVPENKSPEPPQR